MQLLIENVDPTNNTLSSTKSSCTSTKTATVSIRRQLLSGQVKNTNSVGSLGDEWHSQSSSDNDAGLSANGGHLSVDAGSQSNCSEQVAGDDDDSDYSVNDCDVTLMDADDIYNPKNEAERMFYEIMEVLRYEQEVRFRL